MKDVLRELEEINEIAERFMRGYGSDTILTTPVAELPDTDYIPELPAGKLHLVRAQHPQYFYGFHPKKHEIIFTHSAKLAAKLHEDIHKRWMKYLEVNNIKVEARIAIE